jgi:hypothetical protein
MTITALKNNIEATGRWQEDQYIFYTNVVALVNELQARDAANLAAIKSLLNRTASSPGIVIGTGATTSYRHGNNIGYLANGIWGVLGAAADHAFTAAHVITQNLWGVFLLSLNAAGTWKSTVPLATQAYSSEALAIAAMPAAPDAECIVGYITIRARSTANFTGNTTTLTADNGSGNSQTVNYYQGGLGQLPSIVGATTMTNTTALKLTSG